ncbi:hypothetical protein [Endozoicomonas sp. ONNA2]|uniref:hypothetical protein n=1 Tax=Endozoicomonas sp. ONNA2 TaxID=2828741 RepID=UPI0021479F03|nr:hypothetical protein [Endozoicomonas sp. ONNA2]
MELLQSIKTDLYGQYAQAADLEYVVQDYVKFVRHEMKGRSYNAYSAEMTLWLEEVESLYDIPTLQLLRKLTLIELMKMSVEVTLQPGLDKHLPTSAIDAVRHWFQDLCRRIREAGDHEFDNNDLFHKDLAIAALNMWPGNFICHYEPRPLPRRSIFSCGIRQIISAAQVLISLGNRSQNMYEVHVEDRRLTPHFLQDGWRDFYLEISERIESEPGVGGIFGKAWFWDASMKEHSPRMSYLRDLPEAGGALFFPARGVLGSDHIALDNPRRRRLYEAGQYTPTESIMIWTREKLLDWARLERMKSE